ncbi:MAG TPA: glycoside hydrolase domain-containing protein [Thermoguttaceae bacterium]|nr:glycoside hydrolase domain-containing protein [Thermoguttaceae bacterium]
MDTHRYTRPGLAVALLLSNCLFAVAMAEAADNLVPNAGFEEVAPGGKVPAGWQFSWKQTHSGDARRGVEKQEPDFAIDEEEVHGGRRSVRIGVARPQDDGVLTAESVPIDPAVKVYRASVWIKTQALRDTTARLAVVFLGEGGKWLAADYGLIAAEEDHDWKRYVGFFMPAKGTHTLRLRLWMNFEYAGTGTAWFDDVAIEPTDLEEPPPLVYVDRGPTLPVEPEDVRRGYVPFVRSTLETVYPGSLPRPGERLSEFRLTGFPGELEAATFCVRALGDVSELTIETGELRSSAGETIPAADVRVNPVECLVRQGQSRWGPLAAMKMLQPVYVEETDKTSVAQDTTRQLWVTIAVPENAPEGDYVGKITLRTAKSEWSLPVSITVYPFALPEVEGVAFGMYSRLHEDDAFMDFVYADMRRHGMTTVGLCCPLGAEMTMVDGAPYVAFADNADLVRAMRAYVKAGFPEPVCWLMGSDVLQWGLRQGPLESEAFAGAYRGVILAIVDHAKQAGWPEIIFQPLDEPFEHTERLPGAKRCLEIMKTIPGLRTEEDGPNGNPSTLDELYDLCDVIAYHDGPFVDRAGYDAAAWDELLKRTRADGKTIWFYNVDLTGYHPEAMRFGYGFGLWLARGQGVIEWAFMFRYRKDREDWAYEEPTAMFFRYPRTQTHVGGPSIGWEATREGVKDYKLLRLFDRKVAEAKQSGDARRIASAAKAEAAVREQLGRVRFDKLMARAGKGRWTGPTDVLDDGTRTVSGQFKMPNGWTFADYDRTRRLVADAILELDRLAKTPPAR